MKINKEKPGPNKIIMHRTTNKKIRKRQRKTDHKIASKQKKEKANKIQ